MADSMIVGQRKLILQGDETPTRFPAFTITSSDTSVATIGDGGDYRPCVVALAAGDVTITATRSADGATASTVVTITAVAPPDPLPPFTIHLGDAF